MALGEVKYIKVQFNTIQLPFSVLTQEAQNMKNSLKYKNRDTFSKRQTVFGIDIHNVKGSCPLGVGTGIQSQLIFK